MKFKIVLIFLISLITFSEVEASVGSSCISPIELIEGVEGMIRFVDNDLKFCDGTEWLSLKSEDGIIGAPCTDQGKITAGVFCNGVNLYNLTSGNNVITSTGAPSNPTDYTLAYFQGNMNIFRAGSWQVAGTCISNCVGMATMVCSDIHKVIQCGNTTGCEWETLGNQCIEIPNTDPPPGPPEI